MSIQKFSLLFFIFLLFHNLNAQKFPWKWGDVSDIEKNMEFCPIDSSASAVVLCDYGINHFKGFTKFIRIKILSKEGLKYADVSTPLTYNNSNDLKVEGQTINFDEFGNKTIHKLKEDDIYDEVLIDKLVRKKFAMPNVKVGSIIEYSIRSWGRYNWVFQSDIPVLWSEYIVDLPYDKENYHIDLSGSVLFHIKEEIKEYNYIEYRYVMKEIPALKNEPYMTTLKDYYARLRVIRSVSWEMVGEQMGKYYNNIFSSNFKVKKLAKRLNTQEMSKIEKLIFVYNFVKDSINWDQSYSKYISEDNLNDILINKTGNSADLNIIMMIMLKELDIVANPVLVSTRDNGKVIRSNPTRSQFNNVIVSSVIEGKKYLLDINSSIKPYTMLDENVLNGLGFEIILAKIKGTTKTVYSWIEIKNNDKFNSKVFTNVTINDAGLIEGSIIQKESGYYALDKRMKIDSVSEKEFIINQKAVAFRKIDIKDFKISNINEIDKKLSSEINFKTSEFSTVAGNKIYINPIILKPIPGIIFTNNNRSIPVDFAYPFYKSYITYISIPNDFVIDELPKNELIKLPDNGGYFKYLISDKNNQIQILYELNIKQLIFWPGDEYKSLKSLFELVISKCNETVVIHKNE